MNQPSDAPPRAGEDAGAVAFVCATCATQYPPATQPPASCRICEDERQYVGWEGQRWTTLAQIAAGHRADVRPEEPSLWGIGMQPEFAIGQRALLVQSDAGNVLWDCIALLDEPLIARVRELGGVAAIAISHPHFYSTMVEWSRAFDAPIHLHAADRRWVMRPDPAIQLWEGDERPLLDGITLLRLGGHFPGGTVLHWAAGAGGRGALLSADIVHVVRDRRWVSFMRSYPNLIPLSPAEVQRIAWRLSSWRFERIYGGWFGSVVARDAAEAVRRSAQRYLRACRGELE
jgi:hypothetical protein